MTSPPRPPAGLLKPARNRWWHFWESDAANAVTLESDLPRLIRWIQASDEYDRATKVVTQSRLVKGSMGQPVLNPLVAYLAHLEGIIERAEAEFGMTPVARKRLDVTPALGVDPVDELTKRRERRLGGAAG